MPFGLNDTAIEAIRSVFKNYPVIEKVVLYGSRAKGNFRPASDIDLTIIGDQVTHQQLLKIDLALDDLLLPYKIDLSLYSQIDNDELCDHINRVGRIFYKRAD